MPGATKPGENLYALLRRVHEEKVLDALRVRGPSTRAELSAATGVSRPAVSDLVASLLARATVVVAKTKQHERGGRGRPAERLALNPTGGHVLGVDFGHSRVRVVAVDAGHEPLGSRMRRYETGSTWVERVALAWDAIDDLVTSVGVDVTALNGVGVGLPGPFSPSVLGLHRDDDSIADLSAREYVLAAFRDRFRTRMALDNNTRLAALAEATWGGAKGVTDLVYARLSQGVGGGLVVGGRLVTGSAGFAGELGHVSVRADGASCRCGKRGCLETVASLPAVLRACAAEGLAFENLDELAAAAAGGDPLVDRVLRSAGAALGHVLGTMAMALNPAEIVVGGELARRLPTLVAQAEASIRWELQPISIARPRFRMAVLGDDDGALGAVAALLHQSPLLESYPDTAANLSAKNRHECAS